MSTGRNGKTVAVVAFVREHPGCSSDDIEAVTGCTKGNGLLCYAVSTGKVFQSGPRSMRRYYATAEEAEAAHTALCAAALERRRQSKQRNRRRDNDRRREKYAADQAWRRAVLDKCMVRKRKAKLAKAYPGARIVVAPPMRERRTPARRVERFDLFATDQP